VLALQLDDAEASTLREVCDDYLSDLRMEIGKTDRADFREMLKQREVILQRLLDRLPRV